MTTAMAAQLTVIVGSRRIPVASLAEASELFCAARDHFGLGGDQTPTPEIADASGTVIAHISYNGRVWPGDDLLWTPDTEPLYCPSWEKRRS
jgi:hypothetical protein